ncbi:hypothetical protein PT285_00700 [Lactobacillus sp. ESL0791]|uniref:hypothetical protein n=1 Tax=Lactobacillus sp. ESL0791 TaxID=2983234 RepID=UPI0023FA43D2|nr:hypothetical protein [Lactobacillus sp. ESL0791]MDF7637957.1 hypothetical protein [Lactobacillus sp. ESL0791]
MNEKKQDDLIQFMKEGIKDMYEYKCEKQPKFGCLYIVTFSKKGVYDIIVNLFGTIGAYFTLGKTEDYDDQHKVAYEITVTDYGLDLSKYI